MYSSFLTWFTICFFCFALRTIFNFLRYRHHKIANTRLFVNIIYGVMFILWFSWFQMCFIDPVKMSLPLWGRLAGLLLFISGVSLFILAHLKMKGFTEQGFVEMRGIYSKIRNPMYLGFIIWVVGFPIFLEKKLSLLSSIIWISFFMIWKRLEEKELEIKFPEYKEYKKLTWF